MNNFGYLREGNIIRVATLKDIEDQLTAEAKAKEAEQKSGDLITKIIYVITAAQRLSGDIKKNHLHRGAAS